MTRRRAGGPLAAALLLLAAPAAAATLSVVGDDGSALVRIAVPQGGGWCLRWNHSVSGGPVADCFRNVGGTMMLERSYLHDYVAGLGEVPGRGRTVAAEGGGYWIVGIDEPIAGNALPLRVGRAPVDHRITTRDATFDLTARAAGHRVVLRLTE